MALIRRRCPAKINLYLKVLGRRADGYHDLVTVMQPLSLADELTITPNPAGLSLTCHPPHLPQGEDNLVWQAACTFAAATGLTLAVHLELKKNIPVAAGLGGGSSDAANTLLALNLLAGQPLNPTDLHHLACQLGADVPFFLQCGPAVARGIGTDLTPITLPPYWYVLANPGLTVSTRWVYENLDLSALQPASSEVWKDWQGAPPAHWLENDLETVTLRRFPELRSLLRRFQDLGAWGQGMSGSGPTLFGLFPTADHARQAAQQLRSSFTGWLAVARGLTGPEDQEDQAWIS